MHYKIAKNPTLGIERKLKNVTLIAITVTSVPNWKWIFHIRKNCRVDMGLSTEWKTDRQGETNIPRPPSTLPIGYDISQRLVETVPIILKSKDEKQTLKYQWFYWFDIGLVCVVHFHKSAVHMYPGNNSTLLGKLNVWFGAVYKMSG